MPGILLTQQGVRLMHLFGSDKKTTHGAPLYALGFDRPPEGTSPNFFSGSQSHKFLID